MWKLSKWKNVKSFALPSVIKEIYVVPFIKYDNSILGSAEMSLSNRCKAQFEAFLAVLYDL